MAVGQKQIAEKLGVSVALVSRVLSGKAEAIGITPETIERVSKTAEELGYVPSAAALSLKGKATRTIGVVVYDFKDPFFGATIEQLQIQAHKHDYSLVLTGFINRTPAEQDLQPLHKHAIDGLIVIGTDMSASWLDRFSHMPVARIGHGNAKEQSVRISVDENAAAALLIDHLKETGRSHPVYICADFPAHHLRRGIFENVSRDRSINLKTENSPERNAFAGGAQIARQILHPESKIDALICATDQVAMGALNVLSQAGVDVPDQIAVTGFDGIAAAEQVTPAITTIRQPLEQITQRAFAAVMTAQKPEKILIPGDLILRQSA